MPGTFRLEIVTPEKVVYDGEVVTLQAPGVNGYFGILHNRAPLITGLQPGQVKFQEAEGDLRYVAVTGGFFEIRANHAVLLADDADFAEDLDAAATQAELDAARAAMLAPVPSEEERERRQQAVAVADARARVAAQGR